MTEVYLLQNSEGLYLNKHQEWVDGSDANSLYRTVYKDDAINTKVEITVKAPYLRIKTVLCGVSDKGVPKVPAPNEEQESQ